MIAAGRGALVGGVVALAQLAGVLGGAQIGAWAAGLALAGGLGASAARWGRRSVGASALQRWRTANATALALAALAAVLGVSLLGVALALVSWLQAHRAATGRRPADDRIALLLALMMVLLSCILTLSGWLALVFGAFAALLPMALVRCHLDERGGSAALIPLPAALWGMGPGVLALAALLFFALPRIDASGLGASAADGSVAGFGDDVRLGDLGAIKDNPEVVLRVRAIRADGQLDRGPLYLRGRGLDHFDGDRWSSTLTGQVDAGWWPVQPGEGLEVLVQEIVQMPLEDRVLFGVPELHSLRGLELRPTLDLNGTWRHRGPPRRLEYTAHSVLRPRRSPRPQAEALKVRAAGERAVAALVRSGALTDLPVGLDPRVSALAAEWAGGDEDPLDVAEAIEARLRSEYAYSLLPDPADQGQSLSGFLFGSRRGHCEYFATALAVMLRSRGIPARVVNGFYGGEFNVFGEYLIIRQSDAHAWVEIWTEAEGWVQLDATPAAAASAPAPWAAAMDALSSGWQGVVLDYGLDAQLELGAAALGALRVPGAPAGGPPTGLVGPVALIAALVAAAGLWRRGLGWLAGEGGPRPRRGPLDRELARAWALVARRGWAVPAGLPPRAAAGWLRQQAGDGAAALEELVGLAYRARYGGEAPGDLLPDARRAAAALRRGLPPCPPTGRPRA